MTHWGRTGTKTLGFWRFPPHRGVPSTRVSPLCGVHPTQGLPRPQSGKDPLRFPPFLPRRGTVVFVVLHETVLNHPDLSVTSVSCGDPA